MIGSCRYTNAAEDEEDSDDDEEEEDDEDKADETSLTPSPSPALDIEAWGVKKCAMSLASEH